MNNRLRAFLELLVASIMFWVLAFILFITLRYNGLPKELSVYTDENLGIPIKFYYSFAVILGLVIAIFYAVIEFLFDFFISRKLILGVNLAIKSLIYFILIIIIMSLLTFFIEEQIDIDLPNERGWWRKNAFFWNTVIYFVVSSTVFSFIRIANNKFGRGVLINMLLGKYRRPKEENRILMFVDLKDSTKIAEKLGHIQYSKFIQSCFMDLNTVLNKFDSEVYQYVGDEAVMSWIPSKGFKNNNCINLYYAFIRKLESKKEYYHSAFGVMPEFKAGLHYGKIMIAEVGSIKKELAFHGDVINTASRIQGLCKALNSKLLVSEIVLNHLSIDPEKAELVTEDIVLKGKQEKLKIFKLA